MQWGAIGSLALGIFVGYLAWFWVVRLASYTTKTLAAILTVILGGVAVQFLTNNIKADGAGFGQYATGLLIGLIAYAVLYRMSHGVWPVNVGPSGP